MHIQISDLVPLVHPYNWSLYRVPLRKVSDDYYVYLGNGIVRIFTSDTLPDCIKGKMAMILASSSVNLYRDHDRSFGVCELMNNYPSDALDTGWRGSDTFFVVVIERQDLDSMVGEVLHKEQEK
jgi:hypothetical protein